METFRSDTCIDMYLEIREVKYTKLGMRSQMPEVRRLQIKSFAHTDHSTHLVIHCSRVFDHIEIVTRCIGAKLTNEEIRGDRKVDSKCSNGNWTLLKAELKG